MKKELFILGSGESINSLSAKERAYINSSSVKFAQNKFTAFYKKAEIVPTHVFFVDHFSYVSINVFQYILDLCAREKLWDMKFVVNEKMRRFFFKQKGLVYYALKYNPLSLYKGFPYRPYYHLPYPFSFDFIQASNHLVDGPWAKNLDEEMFHFRSSLTSMLNYISIVFPGYTIKLIGVDLNSSGYFFDDEIKELNMVVEDWTTTLSRKQNTHFTALEYKGTSMLDKFPFMIRELSRTQNALFNCNPDSLLVEKGLVPFKAVME